MQFFSVATNSVHLKTIFLNSLFKILDGRLTLFFAWICRYICVSLYALLNMFQTLIDEIKCVELLVASGFLAYFPPDFLKRVEL